MSRLESRAPDDLVERYTQGECHHLAIALHRLLGCPFLVVLDRAETFWEDPRDSDDFLPAVAHVAVLHEGQVLDIFGAMPAGEAASRFDEHFMLRDVDTEILFSEEDLQTYIGEWGEDSDGNLIDRPLFAHTEEDLLEARAVIDEYKGVLFAPGVCAALDAAAAARSMPRDRAA